VQRGSASGLGEKYRKTNFFGEVGTDNMMGSEGGIQCGGLGCPGNLLVGGASFKPPGFPHIRRMFPSVHY
jgi:hypothetical protein